MDVDLPPSAPGPAGGPPASLAHLAGLYPQGVCVVTYTDADGRPAASRVLTFFPVSENPPRVGLVIRNGTQGALTGGFGINILSADQAGFHRSMLDEQESPEEWQFTSAGIPVLRRTVAWMEAGVETATEVADGLYMVVARVRTHGENSRTPLVALLGGYGELRTSTLSAVSGDLTESLHVVDLVRPEMENLAVDLGARVTAAAFVGDHLVFLASAGRIENHVGPVVPIGSRAPAIAPVGATFMAWASSERVERWLSLLDRAEDPRAARAAAESCLSAVRARGFTVYLTTPTHDQLWVEVAHGRVPTSPEDLSDKEFALFNTLVQDPPEFGPDSVGDVEWLSVPVFGPTSEVLLTLGVEGLPHPHDWQEFEARLARLEQATSNATRAVGGRIPVELDQVEGPRA